MKLIDTIFPGLLCYADTYIILDAMEESITTLTIHSVRMHALGDGFAIIHG